MRLDRFISQSAGIPRREATAWIRAGRVQVEGAVVRNGRMQVALAGEEVRLDNEVLRVPGQVTLMMHKPRGCISATRSRQHETVLDHVPASLMHRKLAPVGRLDKDTTGLLILTTDGGLSHRITHPRHKVAKVYLATLKAPLPSDAPARFEAGLVLADGTQCRPATLEHLPNNQVRVVLTEGRYHQVKRMLGAVHGHVIALHREKIGPLALDAALAEGEVRPLTESELTTLITALALPADATDPARDRPDLT